MSSCCASRGIKIASCPNCGKDAKSVSRMTVLHNVVAPLNQHLSSEKYYFCGSTVCNTVYFTVKNEVFERSKIRVTVGQKSVSPDRILCYCFDISHASVMAEIKQTGSSVSEDFVMEQTKLKNCACDIRNPSGRCCLKDFP